MSDSFTVYRNTLEALEAYPPEAAIKMLSAMGHYVMDGIEPDKTDLFAYGFFLQIKPLLDKSRKKAEAGRIGGSIPQANVSKPMQTEANGKLNKKEESRKEKKDNKKDILSDESVYQYRAIVDYLNEKAGTQYKYSSSDTRSHIRARIDSGFSFDDFKTVIDKKVAEWGGTDMAKYLRPSTLFGTKFEAYLNQQSGQPRQKNKFNNFSGRSYDYDALERALTGVGQ